jgi:hypothetical protein
LTVRLRVAFDLSLWEAIKWRIAGPEFRDELVRRMRESMDDDDEPWRRAK